MVRRFSNLSEDPDNPLPSFLNHEVFLKAQSTMCHTANEHAAADEAEAGGSTAQRQRK